MSLVSISGSLIPLPEGADATNTAGLKEAMKLFEPKHFIMPFMAHALGTLVGAMVAALIATTHKIKFAFAIGAFFLLGGIAMVTMVPSPTWFAAIDLIGAYIPMAWVGYKLASSLKK